MLKVSAVDYGVNHDDVLIDHISSLGIIACNIGEMIGPVYAGVSSDWLGIENCCNIAALATFIFAIISCFGTNLIKDARFFKQEYSGSDDTADMELENHLLN